MAQFRDLNASEVRYLKAYLRYLLGKRPSEPRLPNDSYPDVTREAGHELRELARETVS